MSKKSEEVKIRRICFDRIVPTRYARPHAEWRSGLQFRITQPPCKQALDPLRAALLREAVSPNLARSKIWESLTSITRSPLQEWPSSSRSNGTTATPCKSNAQISVRPAGLISLTCHGFEECQMAATGQTVLRIASQHLGEKYLLGTPVPKDNPDWDGPWDCAEFASWLIFQAAKILYV